MDEEKPKSIDETLEEEYDRLNEEVETEEETEEPETEDSGEETDTPSDTEPEPEPEPEPDLSDTEPDEYKKPPSTWRAEAKSKWKEVPNWLKEEVHKREKDSLSGVTSLKEKAGFADRLNQTIQPYQPLLNSMGVTPERAVKDALNLAHSLKTGSPQEKIAIVRSIAQQYQVDLSKIGQAPNAMEQQFAPYQQKIKELETQIRQFTESTQQEKLSEAQRQVQEFENETNENGELEHPYFENVRQDMQILIEAGRATTLKDAYEKACWADPSIRPLIMNQQSSEANEKRKADEKKRVEKAKKSSRNNLEANPASGVQVKAKGSIEETLSEAYDSLMAEG